LFGGALTFSPLPLVPVSLVAPKAPAAPRAFEAATPAFLSALKKARSLQAADEPPS